MVCCLEIETIWSTWAKGTELWKTTETVLSRCYKICKSYPVQDGDDNFSLNVYRLGLYSHEGRVKLLDITVNCA